MSSHTHTTSFEELETAAEASILLSDHETLACLARLQRRIARSNYSHKISQLFCDIVNNSGKISLILFPPSDVLRTDLARKARGLVKRMKGDIKHILENIEENISLADLINGEIQALQGNRHDPLTTEWMEMIRQVRKRQ